MSLTVLIVDDEKNARKNIGAFLGKKKYEVLESEDIKNAKKHLAEGNADIVLLDVQLPDGLGTTLLEETANELNRPPIILITAHGDIDMAVEAMRNGAHDFLQKPIKFERLEKSIERAGKSVTMRRELMHLREAQIAGKFVQGQSPPMQKIYDQAEKAAKASATILISGETGTGKEVIAQAIRRFGPRADKPFIWINCAAVPANTIESELFGHEAGAFTGAEKKKPGLMEVADTGILFLDEISSMPEDMQAKLLKALEDRSFRRMAGTVEIKVDVQVVAASNKDLKKMMDDGTFRNDLYYRLNVLELVIPPLRERREEIPELIAFFVRDLNAQMGMNINDISPEVMDALLKAEWPGNIRELRNVIERAMILCDGPALDVPHFPEELFTASKKPAPKAKRKSKKQ
jgi:DNA-binding NtrC family response regulator